MSVIILGALGVTISTSVVLLGLGSSQSSYTYDESNRARMLAEACIEEGLQKIREGNTYTGSGELTFTSDRCNYLVEDIASSQKRITASSTVRDVTRRISVDTSALRPKIIVNSWIEVAN